jgi:hypothetical protein
MVPVGFCNGSMAMTVALRLDGWGFALLLKQSLRSVKWLPCMIESSCSASVSLGSTWY